jgi:AraC-like DNA-binding protein
MNLRLIAYATISHHRDWRYPFHLHQHHEVIAVESGRMTVEMRGQTFRARAGEVLFYRAGCAHKEDADPKALATTLCLSYAGEYLADRISPLTQDRGGRVRQMLRWMHADMTLPLAQRQGRVTALLGAIVEELAFLAQPREHPIVERTRGYVREHLSERITLDDLAAQAGTTKYHFLRSYHAQTGMTPMSDVRRQRLEQARNLIVSTSWPLRVIAARVGFNTEFHLAKLFRQHLGIAPSSLRRR